MDGDRGTIPFPEMLIARMRSAQNVVVMTGAGISAESGIPTFREAQTGLWAQYRPEELATPDAFRRNPSLVWQWYAGRQDRIMQAAPNAGHEALVEMERRVPHFTLITQNVDGLHRLAGSNPLELHGNIFRVKCFEENCVVEQWAQTEVTPPRCPRCNAFLRPDVVWFGESLPENILQEAEQATRETDVFFSIGTSSLVYPAADLPFQALQYGAMVVEINPAPTALSPEATFCLHGPAGTVLPALVKAIWS